MVVSPDKTSWVEIEVKDEEGIPRAFEPYEIELPDGSVLKGKLDASGQARIEGIDPGSSKVSFPGIHADDWKKS